MGVATVSASAGALLAVAIAGTPLRQAQLPESLEGAAIDLSQIFNQDEPISSGATFRLPQLTRPVNILVLGTKVLTTDVNEVPEDLQNVGYHALVNSLDGLTDTMLLVRFSPQTHQVAVLSLPRDTRTWVDGAGVTKLNEANAIGGPALTARATSELLGGVGIDRYIRINVQGVEKLIDALGGVTVYVPQDMKYQDESQHLYINLKQGEQHLDGSKAMQFLRFRYDAYGDIGRVQRQQMLMRALLEQALKPATLTRLPQILSIIRENLDTNLSVEELVALIGFAAQTDRPNAQMLMLPGRFDSEGGSGYWLPVHHEIDVMVQQYFGQRNAAPVGSEIGSEAVKIAIQDSTGDTYALQTLINQLGNAGYGRVDMDYPWDEMLSTTQIIAQQGDLQSATAIQRVLGFGEVLVESTGNLSSDITIRLGQDAFQALQPPPNIPNAGLSELEPPISDDSALNSTFNPAIDRQLDPPGASPAPESDLPGSDLSESSESSGYSEPAPLDEQPPSVQLD
jgi:LCP family protein required for cell wall assembly